MPQDLRHASWESLKERQGRKRGQSPTRARETLAPRGSLIGRQG